MPRPLAVLALLAVCQCHPGPAAPSAYVRAAQAEASTPLSGALPPSYAQPYASGLRSSRVAVAPGHYTSLTRIDVGWPPSGTGAAQTPAGERVTPRFVLVPPDAAHLAVDWGTRFDLRGADGACIFLGRKERGFDVAVSDGAAYLHGNELLWDGQSAASPRVTTGSSGEGAILAMRYEGDRRLLVVEDLPDRPGGRGPWGVRVSQDRFTTPDHAATAPVAGNAYATRGVAAVAGDFRTVLATADRVLRVLHAGGDPQSGLAPELLHAELPYDVRLLSIAPPRILLVADDPATGGSTLHCVGVDGAERWSARLPFARGDEPPVDLGRGRVAVTGGGIAALEDGRVMWSMPSRPPGAPVRATAFEDGTLAVAMGSELRFVDREGGVRQVLRTGEGETLSTPPAIARDGAVWVATEKGLYVAR